MQNINGWNLEIRKTLNIGYTSKMFEFEDCVKNLKNVWSSN